MNEQRSDVNCTNCGGTFIATLDLDLNGNHEITCPLCAHVHYRVVRDGVVTEERYRSSAGPIYTAMASTSVNLSVSFTTYSTTTGASFRSSWLNRTDLNL